MTTLLVASLAAVGGPLAELPFLSLGWWEYYDSPALYYPLAEIPAAEPFATLGIHSLTGPCYFAVTMDAIALARWFAAMETITMPPKRRQQATNENQVTDTTTFWPEKKKEENKQSLTTNMTVAVQESIDMLIDNKDQPKDRLH
jgi:hypothetical protein